MCLEVIGSRTERAMDRHMLRFLEPNQLKKTKRQYIKTIWLTCKTEVIARFNVPFALRGAGDRHTSGIAGAVRRMLPIKSLVAVMNECVVAYSSAHNYFKGFPPPHPHTRRASWSSPKKLFPRGSLSCGLLACHVYNASVHTGAFP